MAPNCCRAVNPEPQLSDSAPFSSEPSSGQAEDDHDEKLGRIGTTGPPFCPDPCVRLTSICDGQDDVQGGAIAFGAACGRERD